jgi:hypothetical protein
MKTLDIDVIKLWLQSDTPETIHFSFPPNILVVWLLKKQWEDTQKLCTALWREVRYPPNVMHQLSQIHN